MSDLILNDYVVSCENSDCLAFGEELKIEKAATTGTVYCGSCNNLITNKTLITE
jgi:hypothetical protein